MSAREDLKGQPSAFDAMRRRHVELEADAISYSLDPTKEARQRQRAYYLANVSMIDRKVGEILEALQAKGLLENSVVMFTSDHGDTLGDHGHSQKWTMYEQVVRVPLVVWGPGHVTPGRAVGQLVQHMDIGPTILEIAGVPVPSYMEARTLMPLLQGNQVSARDLVFAELGPDNVLEKIRFMTMVRSERWKLVHLLGVPDGQLFDLTEDPHEERNLWYEQSYAAQKRELLDAIFEWRLESQIQTRGWLEGYR